MAYTTINKHNDFFNTVTYTGNGSATNAVTGTGFEADLVWIKDRNQSSDHQIQDSVRGKSGSNYYYIHSNSTAGQGVQSDYDGVNTIGTDGFTVGYSNSTAWNQNNIEYVSWNWKAGTTSGLSGGTITPSSYSINTTSGFGIYTYSGTGSNATIAHGLGAKPSLIFVKILNTTDNWCCYHKSLGATKRFELNNSTTPTTHSSLWNDTEPTTSVFTVGTNGQVNGSGNTYVAYVFTEKTGYFKCGKYTGNADTNLAPFIYTGFKPKLLMLRNITNGNRNLIFDDKRTGMNTRNWHFGTDVNLGEETGWGHCDLYSNGFKPVSNDGSINGASNEYIYWAFGQSLVGSNNVPCTAR